MVYYNNKIYPLNSVKKNLPNIFLFFCPVLVEVFLGAVTCTPFGIHVPVVSSSFTWMGHQIPNYEVEPILDCF